MRALLHTAVAVLFVASCANAQTDGADLLRRVAETYRNLKTFHFESVAENELSSELDHSTSTTRMTLAESADRLRVEFQAIGDWSVLVSDGKTLWRAAPFTRQFMRTTLNGPALETRGGGQEGDAIVRRSKYLLESNSHPDENLLTARVLRDETIQVGSGAVDCVVVVADYKPSGAGVRSTTKTFWIDKVRNIIVQEDSVSQGNLYVGKPFLESESRTRVHYTVASVNEPVPDALFTYAPPANFRELDKLEHWEAFRPTLAMIGKPAPEVNLKTLDGKPVSLPSLRGKTVLLDFWATWCVPCRAQMPEIARLYHAAKDQGLVLLGVDDDETPATAEKFTTGHGYDWPHAFDGVSHLARQAFKITGIPTLVLIDKKGTILDVQVGVGAGTEGAIQADLRTQGFQLPK